MTKYPTLPSLAFAIFRSKNLPKLNKKGILIPLIIGSMWNDIKKSYTGGAVDVYRSNFESKKIKGYDVNSLYPSRMFEIDMPVCIKNKSIKYFEGNILQIKNIENLFGFFEVEVDTKNYKYPFIPIIQNRFDKGSIAPLGN
jgi:hypothetical protein